MPTIGRVVEFPYFLEGCGDCEYNFVGEWDEAKNHWHGIFQRLF